MIKRSVLILFSLTVFIVGCKKGKKEVVSGSEGNHPPIIESVSIIPENPSSREAVKAFVNASDEDRDAVNLSYVWAINGSQIDTSNDYLQTGAFRKGDLITVTVTPNDGKVNGESVSASVNVANSVPYIENIKFEPPVPTARTNLNVIPSVKDPDGDSVTVSFVWTVDGSQIEGVSTNILPSQYLKKGAAIIVEAIPSDGESTGASLVSAPVVVANTPPIIMSSPPHSIQGNSYIYSVVANDPDGDAISFSLENAPEGMTIDSKNGALNWQLSPEQKGEYTFTVIAEDADGAKAIQSITVGF